MGSSCAMRHGGRCCCRYRAALLKKFPQLAREAAPPSCSFRQAPLAPTEATDGQHDLPSQEPHTLLNADLRFSLALERALLLPAPRGSSYHPEPPTPIPD